MTRTAHEALYLIDFTLGDLLGEAAQVGSLSAGAVTYQDLRQLPFPVYDTLVQAAKSQLKKRDAGE